MKVYGDLEAAALENVSSDPAAVATSIGRLVFDTVKKQPRVQVDATTWGGLGGGGGGGSLNWDEPPGEAPVKGVENSQIVFAFEPGKANKLVSFIKVPQTYVDGSQLQMLLSHYSPSTSNTVLLSTTSYLVRKGTDAISSVANSHASTNTAITNSGVADKLTETTVDITDALGEINSIALTPGDLIRVELSRGTDTDTENIRFIPNGTEVN